MDNRLLVRQASRLITAALHQNGNHPSALDPIELVNQLWSWCLTEGLSPQQVARPQVVEVMHQSLDDMVGLYGMISYVDNRLRYQVQGSSALNMERLGNYKAILVWSAHRGHEANAEHILRQCQGTALGGAEIVRALLQLLLHERGLGDQQNDNYLHYLLTEGQLRVAGIPTRAYYPQIERG